MTTPKNSVFFDSLEDPSAEMAGNASIESYLLIEKPELRRAVHLF